MGSTQSARRIQPSGVVWQCWWSPGGSFPPHAPPIPPTQGRPPITGRVRSGGCGGMGGSVGGGVGGVPPPQPTDCHHLANFHPGDALRLALGWLGSPSREGGLGVPCAHTAWGRGSSPPPVLQPPRSSGSPPRCLWPRVCWVSIVLGHAQEVGARMVASWPAGRLLPGASSQPRQRGHLRTPSSARGSLFGASAHLASLSRYLACFGAEV